MTTVAVMEQVTSSSATPGPIDSPENFLPHPGARRGSDDAAAFWDAAGGTALQMPHCSSCEAWFFPPAPTCPTCDSPAGSRAVSGNGSVYTFTVSASQFHPEVPPPFVIAVVELDDQPGLRIPTNIVGCPPEEVTIGMPVTASFDTVIAPSDDAPGLFVPVFRPRG